MDILSLWIFKGLVLKAIARALGAGLMLALIRVMPIPGVILALAILVYWCLS